MKFTLPELIEEADNEKRRREQTYPNVFAPTEEWQARSKRHIDMMAQIAEILRFIHKNEAAFKALITRNA